MTGEAPNVSRTARAERGSITAQPGHLIDFMATCVEVAGAKYPREYHGRGITPLQGRSLLPILHGEERAGHDWLYFQFADNRALRQGDWKLVSARGGRWELYDLAHDRTELDDLTAQHPDRVAELRALWHHAAENVDGAPAKQRRPATDRHERFPNKAMTQRRGGR